MREGGDVTKLHVRIRTCAIRAHRDTWKRANFTRADARARVERGAHIRECDISTPSSACGARILFLFSPALEKRRLISDPVTPVFERYYWLSRLMASGEVAQSGRSSETPPFRNVTSKATPGAARERLQTLFAPHVDSFNQVLVRGRRARPAPPSVDSYLKRSPVGGSTSAHSNHRAAGVESAAHASSATGTSIATAPTSDAGDHTLISWPYRYESTANV